jgi:hypothetical protein
VPVSQSLSVRPSACLAVPATATDHPVLTHHHRRRLRPVSLGRPPRHRQHTTCTLLLAPTRLRPPRATPTTTPFAPTALPDPSDRFDQIRPHSFVSTAPTTFISFRDLLLLYGRVISGVRVQQSSTGIPRASSRSFPAPLPPSTRPLSGHCRAVWLFRLTIASSKRNTVLPLAGSGFATVLL